MSKLTKQELELIKILEDPMLWAQVYLKDRTGKPATLRWYQADMIKSKSIRKVSRMGRRTGKCISEHSQVITSNGPISAETLYKMTEKPPILTFNEESQQVETTEYYSIWPNGKKPVYKITTMTGRVNYATGNHPFLSINEDGFMDWVDIDNMLVGDRIAVPATYEDLIQGKDIGDNSAKLLGYLCGDGGTSQNFVSFTNFDSEIVEDFKALIEEKNCTLKDYGTAGNYRAITNQNKNNQVIRFCKEHNLIGKLAVEKEVPQAILGATKSNILSFLGAYWDCDGWLSTSNKTKNIEIGCSSSSKQLAKGIHHLLLRVGIVSKLKYKKVKYNNGFNNSWQVVIYDIANVKKFINNIPLKAKKREFTKILKVIDGKQDSDKRYIETIPKQIWSYIKSKPVKSFNSIGVKVRPQYSMSRTKLLELNEIFNDEYLEKLAKSNILWDKVVSIEYIGEQETYDLHVPGTHTFISDDIISHNTFTMCTHMLWYAFTHEKAACVVATPYEAQINLIFNQLREFIDSSPAIQESIEYNRRNPQEITFKNGSYIKGFTAGTRSGAQGGSLRGQRADWLYMDEVDYMTDQDFETIYAIALEAPERIGVWISSTPTGRRGKFYDACNNKKLWKEFYFPSQVNPEYNDNMEAEFRSMFSQVAYEHEVLAEFGEETVGVFKKEYIDRARSDYLYADKATDKRPRVMGIDWDRQICPYSTNCWKLLRAA